MRLDLQLTRGSGQAIIGPGRNPGAVVGLTEQIPGESLGSRDVVLAWDIPPGDVGSKTSMGTVGERSFLVPCDALGRYGSPTVYDYPKRI
jgi:hypothetical protein